MKINDSGTAISRDFPGISDILHGDEVTHWRETSSFFPRPTDRQFGVFWSPSFASTSCIYRSSYPLKTFCASYLIPRDLWHRLAFQLHTEYEHQYSVHKHIPIDRKFTMNILFALDHPSVVLSPAQLICTGAYPGSARLWFAALLAAQAPLT